jgi:hypothetical protein
MDTKKALAISGIVLILALTAGVFFWQLAKSKPVVIQKQEAQNPLPQAQLENNQPVASVPENNIITPNTSLALKDDQVLWYSQPKPVKSLNLFKKDNIEDLSIATWEMGEIKNTGEKIILAAIDPNDPGGVREYFFAVSKAGGINPYSRYSMGNFLDDFSQDTMSSYMVLRDNNYDRINSLEYPGLMSFNGMVFQYESDKIFDLKDPFFHPEKHDNFKKIYADNIYGDVYLNNEDGGIYLKSPLGIAKVYALKIPIMGNDEIPDVIWNDGSVNKRPFVYKNVGGCGASGYAAVVNDISENNLVQIGKTKAGDPIYGFKDLNSDYLKKWYQENDNYVGPDAVEFLSMTGEKGKFSKKTTYAEFVSQHLMFFWKDPLGRLIRFLNEDYVFGGGGCGKPVIYLYPAQTENVSVNITPTGGMTASEPAYNRGWNVSADPQSNLTNLADGKTYPYLFWEGRGDSIYQMPQKGFVASRENLENLLNEKLAQSGLIPREISDFKDFWLPKMLVENKPYYFVTFVLRREIDKLAPLSITPRPDTVIRVLMDYRGLDNYKSVPGFSIPTPERKGFTAVEWGGVLK